MSEKELLLGTDYFLVRKETSRFMKFLAFIMFFNKDFMTRYVTTIGRTIYAPGGVVERETLLHELQHVRDYIKWNVLFYISYLLVLPLGWTMRAYWEKKAYAISIKERWRVLPSEIAMLRYKGILVGIFTGSDYLYMSFSKKKIGEWFDRVLNEVKKEIANG